MINHFKPKITGRYLKSYAQNILLCLIIMDKSLAKAGLAVIRFSYLSSTLINDWALTTN